MTEESQSGGLAVSRESMGETSANGLLHWEDFTVLGLYFAIFLGLTLEATRRDRNGGTEAYFLASRSMNWLFIGTSLFASNIGAHHFLGLSGTGATSGIAVAGFEQSITYQRWKMLTSESFTYIKDAVYILMMMGWFFIPVYMSSQVYTVPEYLKKRFGSQRIKLCLALCTFFIYFISKMYANLYAAAIFIQRMTTGHEKYTYVVVLMIMLGMAAVATVAGGQKAVMWTDLFQTVIMICGAGILMILSLQKVGGLVKLLQRYPAAEPQEIVYHECHKPPRNYWSLIQGMDSHKNGYPWPGMIFGLGINSIFYWCVDQVMVHRALTGKNILHVKGGCILTSYLKFLPLWFIVLPGMVSRVLYLDTVLCGSPETCYAACGNPSGCSFIAYAELSKNLMPAGLRGLMIAVIASAMISTLTACVISLSTIFTMDIWIWAREKFLYSGNPPNDKDKELVMVGRVTSFLLLVVTALYVPVIMYNDSVHDYPFGSTSLCFGAPIGSVCSLAIFWKKTTEPGAFWGLMVGLTFGIIRYVLEHIYPSSNCSTHAEEWPRFIQFLKADAYLQFYSSFLCLITIAVIVIISLFTKPIPGDKLCRLTYKKRHDKVRQHRQLDRQGPRGTLDITENGTTCYDPENCNSAGDEASDNNATRLLMEPKFWKNFVNINAIICLILSTLMYSFFSH